MPTINERIKTARERAGYSRADFAALIFNGESQSHNVAMLETCEDHDVPPSPSIIEAIIEHCNVSVEWLKTGNSVTMQKKRGRKPKDGAIVPETKLKYVKVVDARDIQDSQPAPEQKQTQSKPKPEPSKKPKDEMITVVLRFKGRDLELVRALDELAQTERRARNDQIMMILEKAVEQAG